MSIIRSIKIDEEFVKNMPSDLLSELIILNDVIPIHLENLIEKYNYLFDRERRRFIWGLKRDDPILSEMSRRRKELKEDYDNHFQRDFEYDLEFLKKYPQFKPVAKHINLIDDDKVEIVGTEPLP